MRCDPHSGDVWAGKSLVRCLGIGVFVPDVDRTVLTFISSGRAFVDDRTG